MEQITTPPTWVLHLAGWELVFNQETLVMSWVVMALALLAAGAVALRPRMVPNPLQNLAEILVVSFRALVNDSLGRLGPRYFAFICTLFIFILLSNWLGMVPFLSEPTRDLNTTLVLGLAGFAVAHYSAVRVKGWKRYLTGYLEPFALMLPLNVIGELAKVISISFRLYGNVLGGGIIILVVSSLVRQLVLPPLLSLFFGAFVGTVQAFVFAILTLTYISVAVQE